MKLLKQLLNPNMIEKTGILKSVRLVLAKYGTAFTGEKCLDIGCGSKPYEKEFAAAGVKYLGIDFKSYSKNSTFNESRPDFYFPANYVKNFKLPGIKTGSFGMIASFQVLEHHEKPGVFFSEAKRILKKNGHLLLSVPFIWELHEEPHDYQRLTHYKIHKLAEEHGFKTELVLKRGGVFAAVSQLLNTAFFSIKLPRPVLIPFYLVLLMPFQLLAYALDGHKISANDRKIFLGYTILMKKK